ncbi:butyrate kinase [Maridesulfovibrio zosterae]|uniref:butyrate kinase n=1 Tax=Maridesulfovibrio zosterae TaxID=82171 RepID=UPI000407D4D1|nr:butyrate kinase [Maridesulfovibrio zosterae]
MAFRILIINPGATSTKVAIFSNDKICFDAELSHSRESIDAYSTVMDQKDFRIAAVLDLIKGEIKQKLPDMIVGRGGLLRPIPGGPYSINSDMISDLGSSRYGAHACNLGAIIASELAGKWGVPSMIMDPVVTDEMDPVAKVTGLPEIKRRTAFHALSQRGVARSVAEKLGVDYDKSKFIVTHMGGGMSIGAHRNGKIIDVTNALDGEGPFSPERSGTLPILPVLDLIEAGTYSFAEMRKTITSGCGLLALLGTNDLREVESRIKNGDKEAKFVFDALTYNISKYICSFIPALMKGDKSKSPIGAIILTGGLARSNMLVRAVDDLVGFIAPVHVVTGLEEMEVMGRGGQDVLTGKLQAQTYAAV